MPDLCVRLGLVPAQPEQLGRGEPWQRPVAGQLDQPLEPDPLLDLGALGGRSLVVPEDRGPQDGAVLAEHDEAVHLARQADLALGQARQAGLRGAPPILGVLLGPAGPGRRELVLLARGREQLSLRRDGDCLDAGRADIEADQGPNHAAVSLSERGISGLVFMPRP